jgi:oxygen-dependent protoporphyrinogen oxidase
MGSLVEALYQRMKDRVEFRQPARATGIKALGSRWCVALEAGVVMTADAVVVAVPRESANQLLTPIAGEVARLATAARTVSSVTVSLAYRAESVQHPLDGTGFVVAGLADEDIGLRACTFCTSKFQQRAPGDWLLLRAFFRPTLEGLQDWADQRWVSETTDVLQPLLDIQGAPTRTWVSRWPNALPRFPQAYSAQVHDLTLRLRAEGRVELAGAAFHGVGIDAAVRSGINAAVRLGSEPVYGSAPQP